MATSDAPSSSGAGADADRALAARLSRALVAASADPGTEPSPALELASGGGWDALLEDCVRQVPAIAAFIVDGRGLLVAAAGALGADVLEGTGARVAEALRHLVHLPASGAACRAVIVEYDGEWLTVLPVRLADGELVIGVVGDRPMAPTARAILRAALTGVV